MPFGPAPWQEGYRRVYKKQRNFTHTLEHAWLPNAYLNEVGPKHPAIKVPSPYRLLIAPNGQEYKVYGKGDYTDYYGFQYNAEGVTEDMLDYIEKGFAKNAKFQAVKGVGHIMLLEYNAYRQLLRVTFKVGGSVCVFFRVPKTVFGELYSLCDERKIDGSRKNGHNHLLGIRFWDLVRIRGTTHGAKYKFVYTQEAIRPDVDDINIRTNLPRVWRGIEQDQTIDNLPIQLQSARQQFAKTLDDRWQIYKKSDEYISKNDSAKIVQDAILHFNRIANVLDIPLKARYKQAEIANDLDGMQRVLVDAGLIGAIDEEGFDDDYSTKPNEIYR